MLTLMIGTALALSVDAGLETVVPIHIGVRASIELPQRIRLSSAIGVLPGPYLDTINAVSTGLGFYDDTTASLIDSALSRSLILREHLGWRPFPDSGFNFETGYSLAALGGGLSGVDAVEAVAGITVKDKGQHSFDVQSTLHLVDVSIGWEWVFKPSWVLRADLGAAFTVGSSTEVSRDWEVARRGRETAVDAVQDAAEVELNSIYRKYVHTPTIGLALAWRFGGDD